MKKIIIFGAGGHSNSCIDVILEEKKFRILFIVDDKKKNTKKFNFNVKTLYDFEKDFKNLKNIILNFQKLSLHLAMYQNIQKFQKEQ